jgi:hypothetical protein
MERPTAIVLFALVAVLGLVTVVAVDIILTVQEIQMLINLRLKVAQTV